MSKRIITAVLAVVLVSVPLVIGQTESKDPVSYDVKIIVNDDGKFRQKSARLKFDSKMLSIDGKKVLTKIFKYTDIVSAEYSYSKSPRWKTGMGLTAAAILLPPLWLISIPIGFTKHRRHWLTIRTGNDFAVLKLSKKNRKHLIPTLETRAGLSVKAVGEDK